MGVQPQPPMQTAFHSFSHGQALAEPTLERRPLAANIPVAVAMPLALPTAGGSWPLAMEAPTASIARMPVLACVVHAP